MVWLWVLLFLAIAAGGIGVLVHVVRRVWRSTQGLLEELDVVAAQAGELADLLAQVQVGASAMGTSYITSDPRPEGSADAAWPGTVETYDDAGADAPGKKET